MDDANLKAGYKFKKGRVLYQSVKTWFSEYSIPFTVDSFAVKDTLPEFECYVIVRGIRPLPPLPVPDKNGDIHIVDPGAEKQPRYGAADFDGNIVIFPRFAEWRELGKGYVAVEDVSNSRRWGVLHIRGEMITDIKYTQVVFDGENKNLLCTRDTTGTTVVDTIAVY